MRFIPTPGDIKTSRKHKLKARGFRYPLRVVWAARQVGLPLSYAAALLEKESALGHNVFGHDSVRNPVKGGPVTKARYELYKRYRKQGLGMQGVGPCQLTWYATQDQADSLGGCWKPEINMYVGFKQLMDNIRAHGVWAGVKAYNGTGPAADAYANDWTAKQKQWQAKFNKD